MLYRNANTRETRSGDEQHDADADEAHQENIWETHERDLYVYRRLMLYFTIYMYKIIIVLYISKIINIYCIIYNFQNALEKYLYYRNRGVGRGGTGDVPPPPTFKVMRKSALFKNESALFAWLTITLVCPSERHEIVAE